MMDVGTRHRKLELLRLWRKNPSSSVLPVFQRKKDKSKDLCVLYMCFVALFSQLVAQTLAGKNSDWPERSGWKKRLQRSEISWCQRQVCFPNIPNITQKNPPKTKAKQKQWHQSFSWPTLVTPNSAMAHLSTALAAKFQHGSTHRIQNAETSSGNILDPCLRNVEMTRPGQSSQRKEIFLRIIILTRVEINLTSEVPCNANYLQLSRGFH